MTLFVNRLKEEYYNWLCNGAFDEFVNNYTNLARVLYSIDFYYSIPMDENRYEDGISLRNQYEWIFKLSTNEINSCLDCKPCSVLEMMLALCKRMEAEYMGDARFGNRTSIWFSQMCDSLGICISDDDWNCFSEDNVRNHIMNMMNRNYGSNGAGGLFTIERTGGDMSRIDLWNQMIRKCNELLGFM